MTRQGRSHRGRRGRKKRAMKNGNSAHRQKIQRRKEARAYRHAVFTQLMEDVFPLCDLSRIGVARSLGCSYRPTVHISKNGLALVRTEYDQRWMRGLPSQFTYKVYRTISWDKIVGHQVGQLACRIDWKPLLQKSPLVLLAECVDG